METALSVNSLEQWRKLSELERQHIIEAVRAGHADEAHPQLAAWQARIIQRRTAIFILGLFLLVIALALTAWISDSAIFILPALVAAGMAINLARLLKRVTQARQAAHALHK
jgi:hypothetical protein